MEDEEDDEGDDAATIVVAAAAVAAVAASDVTDIAPNKLCSNVCISARITGCLLTVGKRGGSNKHEQEGKEVTSFKADRTVKTRNVWSREMSRKRVTKERCNDVSLFFVLRTEKEKMSYICNTLT